MRKVLIAALIALATPAALADGPGTVTKLVAGKGNAPLDPRNCTFFQTNGGPTWYSVYAGDPNYDDEREDIKIAYLRGEPLGFQAATTQSNNCPPAYPVSGLSLGQ